MFVELSFCICGCWSPQSDDSVNVCYTFVAVYVV